MSQYLSFVALHQQARPLVLANAWDVASARLFAEAGYAAVGTSSAAVAETLGYADGESMPFGELCALAKRLAAALRVPLSVDLEGGYHREAAGIAQHIEQLADIGVAGVNLEDSVVGANRALLATQDFAATVEAVRNHLVRRGLHVFLNIRTDAFLLGHAAPTAETLTRMRAYEDAGADGLFVPGLVDPDDIQRLTAATALPVNLLALPNLPSFDELAALGVRRVSMGDFAHQALLKHLAHCAHAVQHEQSFRSLF